MCQGMAPPPTARRRCDRPVTAGRSTALKGSAGATSTRARPADRYQDNPSQGVSRFASQAGTQARPTVLLHRPQGGGLSPITLLSTTPCDRRARSASLHILPADSARQTDGVIALVGACRSPSYGLVGSRRASPHAVSSPNGGTSPPMAAKRLLPSQPPLTRKVGGRASDLAVSGHPLGTLVRVGYGACRLRGCDWLVDWELVFVAVIWGLGRGKPVGRVSGRLWPTRRCLVRRRCIPTRRRGSLPGGCLLFFG